MNMASFQEFSFNISNNNTVLPKHLIDSNFNCDCLVKIQTENNNHIIYNIRCSIEKDYYLNNYNFYLKYNKEKDYYILNDYLGSIVEYIYDIEMDYICIEESIINNILIHICGYVPKFYFGNSINIIYSKIYKYLNNNLYKINKQFRNELSNLENVLCKIITMDNIKTYDNNLYKKIQSKFINLFIKLNNKEFTINNISYKIRGLKFEDILLNTNLINYSFKIPKKNLKINNIKY